MMPMVAKAPLAIHRVREKQRVFDPGSWRTKRGVQLGTAEVERFCLSIAK
jgi:hypothetical protein